MSDKLSPRTNRAGGGGGAGSDGAVGGAVGSVSVGAVGGAGEPPPPEHAASSSASGMSAAVHGPNPPTLPPENEGPLRASATGPPSQIDRSSPKAKAVTAPRGPSRLAAPAARS